MINAFSQLGNVAGSYVWDLPENGFRKSYGIVTAMFGVAIVGCLIFRIVLVRLNKQLDIDESTSGGVVDEKLSASAKNDPERANKAFRYLV